MLAWFPTIVIKVGSAKLSVSPSGRTTALLSFARREARDVRMLHPAAGVMIIWMDGLMKILDVP